MQLYHYLVALLLSGLSLSCLSVPINGADRTNIEYQAIEQLTDPLDQLISFEKKAVKKPSAYSIKHSASKSRNIYTKKGNITHSQSQYQIKDRYIPTSRYRSTQKKSNKKKSEQELFDEFLATDALTGELRQSKKRSAFEGVMDTSTSNAKKSNNPSTNTPENNRASSAPKFGTFFKEKFASNKELYGAIQQGKDYFNEQKQKSVNVLKQYNLEFKTKEAKTDILSDAAKSRPKAERSIDHSEIENSVLMRAINFATSWKGITLAIILATLYLLTSALLARSR